jgi:short-subunit dehydrogenase
MSRPLAVVTGTSSGIGKAIATDLLQREWGVVGISRREAAFQSENYTHLCFDLRQTSKIPELAQGIVKTHGPVSALINNAGVGHFAPHEELSPAQIQEMVTLNLLAPLLLTRGFLRSLKETRGYLLSISSFSALESSSFGAAYAATKAGLKHFSDSLFDEVRKSGVKVTTITPDITRTPFYDELTFAPDEDPAAAVTPECVSQVVMQILSQRPETVTTHVVLRPERILLNKRSHATKTTR